MSISKEELKERLSQMKKMAFAFGFGSGFGVSATIFGIAYLIMLYTR